MCVQYNTTICVEMGPIKQWNPFSMENAYLVPKIYEAPVIKLQKTSKAYKEWEYV